MLYYTLEKTFLLLEIMVPNILWDFGSFAVKIELGLKKDPQE